MTGFDAEQTGDAPGFVHVPLLLICDPHVATPRDRGAFLLGFEHGVAMATISANPGGRVRWPIHEANRARVLAGCNALRRRVTFERVFAPMRTAGVHGSTIGVGTGMLVADVRPEGWTPGGDDVLDSAADVE